MTQKSKQIRKLKIERQHTLERITRLGKELQAEVEIRTGTDDDAAPDAAADVYEREKILSHVQALEDKARALEHAISLATKGLYGICEMCGEAIPAERLEIVPETTLCVNCASKTERGIRRHQMQTRPNVHAHIRRPSHDDDTDVNETDEDA